VAVDGEPAAVAATSSLVAEHGLADRVEVVVGELPAAAARAGPFDLIWASRVVHHLADEAAGVRALALLERLDGTLEESDRRALARLTDPSDPADLGRRDDMFALGVQSIHVGSAPAPPGL